MPRIGLLGLCMMACLLLGGCAKEKPSQTTASPAPLPEGTAWWKTEAPPGATASLTTVSGPALAGWTKMPAVVPALATQGQEVFKSKGCVSCHTIGKGPVVGPDLLGLTRRVEPEWVAQFISNAPAMLESDPHAKELLAKYLVKMPNLNLTKDQVRALQEFFRQQDEAAALGKFVPIGK